jgi:membrane protease YdiL (CAAX protease family)
MAPPLAGLLLMVGLAALLIGLAAAAGYQIVARRTRPPARFRGPSPLLLFAIQLVVVSIAGAVLLILGVPVEGSGTAFVTAAIVLVLGYLFVVWLFGFRSGALGLRDIGLPVGTSIGRLLADVGIGAGVMFLVGFMSALWAGIIALLLDTTAPEVVPMPTTGVDIAFIVLGACLLIPIGEEVFFRGYALTAWLRDVGAVSALIRSTLFFTVVHIANIVVEPTQAGAVEGFRQAILIVLVIAPVGLALGWLFLRRGLVSAIAGHAAFNVYGVIGLLLSQNLQSPPA